MTSNDRLAKVLRKRYGIFFCGAGISISPPAGLPDWHSLRDETIKAIALRTEPLIYQADILARTPMISHGEKKGLTPEMVASVIANHCSGYFESFRALMGNQPNSNHFDLARLAKDGYVQIIITTNWDLYIEQALETEDVSFQTHRTEEEITTLLVDVQELKLEGTHVVKLHGCLSKPQETIIVTVEQEARGLAPVKQQLLEELFRSYTVVFWGYSGLDLKIDPDYLRMLTVKDGSPGFIWDFFNPAEANTPHIAQIFETLQR